MTKLAKKKRHDRQGNHLRRWLDEVRKQELGYECPIRLNSGNSNAKILDCRHCNQPVLNLSRMPQREALTRVLNAEEKPCISFQLDQQGQPKMSPMVSSYSRPVRRPVPALLAAGAGMYVLGCQTPEVENIEGAPQASPVEHIQEKVEDQVEAIVHYVQEAAVDASKGEEESKPVPTPPPLPRTTPRKHMRGKIKHIPRTPKATLHFSGPQQYSLQINGVEIEGKSSATVPVGLNEVRIRDHRGQEIWRDQVDLKDGDVRTLRMK